MINFINYNILLAAIICTFCLASCDHKPDQTTPTSAVTLKMEFSNFKLDKNGISAELKCVKSQQSEAFVNYSTKTTGKDSIEAIEYNYITLVDSKGTDFNGFTWQGETELEGVIKNKENTQIRLKLYVKGDTIDENGDKYCTPTIVRAEISDDNYTGELIPNKWKNRLSSEAVLKISRK